MINNLLNILVVDDEDLIRLAFCRILTLRGYKVFNARNGIQALEIITTESIDLIILDLLMPEKNGFDVLAEMKKMIPVIVISAFSGTNADHFHSDDYPQVIGFIKKPFDHLNFVIEHMLKLYENYIRKI